VVLQEAEHANLPFAYFYYRMGNYFSPVGSLPADMVIPAAATGCVRLYTLDGKIKFKYYLKTALACKKNPDKLGSRKEVLRYHKI
jgi:hypothetical protein